MKRASEMTPAEYRVAREMIRRGAWPPPVATPTSPAPSPVAPGSAKSASAMTADEYKAARQRIRRGLHPFQQEPHR